VQDWINNFIETAGYAGLALLTLLENVFPPIPSELIMPLAGFSAAEGKLNFWGAVAAGSAGSLAGAYAWYYLARRISESTLRDWIERRGHWLGIAVEDLDRSMRWFEMHGRWVVFAGRLVPGLRTLISVPAGLACMPAGPFLAYSGAGTLLWTGALTWAGHALGSEYEQVGRYIGPISWIVIGGILLSLIVHIFKRRQAQ
jgi:membrane protein DedA with SNARE-associated domain